MILDKKKIDVDTNIGGKNINFKLDQDSAVLFEILRSKMYTDPIGAICREITANARDANREVGRSHIPIRIWMPGEYLVIKDSGPGISPDRMENVFCIYGASTKRDTNDLVGGFGLGAKTPFAYVDQFTIETVVDNIKYTYIAYIDETNKGNIKLISSDPTDEINGTAIKIPVKPQDRYTFRSNIYGCTQFWDVAPDFIGDTPPEKLKAIIDMPGWALYTKKTHSNYNILCDNIPYVDNRSGIPGRVVLKFKTGEIDLSSNRENLHYNEKTAHAIKQRIELYNREIYLKIQDSLDSIDDFCDVIDVIENAPNYTSYQCQEWTWKKTKFFYPLKKSVYSYHKYRGRGCGRYTTTLNIKDINQIILSSKSIDSLTSYDKQRIGHYCVTLGGEIIVIQDTDPLPIDKNTLTKLEDIKIKRGPSVRSPRVAKTTIKGRNGAYNRPSDFPINPVSETIYTTKEGNEIGGYLSHLPFSIVFIQEKDEKYILNSPKWIEFDKYMDRELYSKYSKEDILKIANHLHNNEKYSHFSFLSGVNDYFKVLSRNSLDKQIPDSIIHMVSFLVKNEKVTPQKIEVEKVYPMLRMVRYINSDGDHKIIKEYVKMIDETLKLEQAQS